MNDVIDKLQITLHSVSQVALARMRLGDSLQMAHERAKLIDWLGGAPELEELTGDRIANALQAFQQGKHIRDLRQARLVCYGCTQPFGTPPQRLIEHSKLFTGLLKYIGRYYFRTRPFRKCYRGLLNSYFSYDPDGADSIAEGRRNWEALRKFLDEHKDNLETSGYTPAWVAAMSAHRNLLGADPCKPYGLAELEENISVFKDIRERLEVSDGSWVIRRIVFSQVEAAVALDDHAFKMSIDGILLLLFDYPLHAGAALAMLLDRYARCDDADISAGLRDFAVKLWGNPWLAASVQQWQCSREAREMVGRWLKRYLLQRFFFILSDDHAGNPRRVDFWELYCDDIQGMYFALGKGAFIRSNQDVYKFRHDAKGLIVRLTEGKNDIHALIMQFNQHHVVEFNHHRNMAYFYDTSHGVPPFYLSRGWVEVGALSANKIAQGTGTAPLAIPLRHQDSGQLAWEGKFAKLMGATGNSIREFCSKYQCLHEDLRTQGGQEWIRPTDRTQCGVEGWSVLLGWGFSLSPDKEGYCRA